MIFFAKPLLTSLLFLTVYMAQSFFFDERAQSEWNMVYMLLVLAIATLLVLSVIKPMYQQSQQVVARQQAKLPK